MERGTKETLYTDEQKEIVLSLDHYYTEETTYDTMEYVVVYKPSTSLIDWPNICQSSLFELPNK